MIFYVYEHWRPDRDLPFYVGKGKGKRAYDFKRRNRLHIAVIKELSALGMCAEVRLVQSGLDEVSAYDAEKERIKFWRCSGVSLVNLTDGGEGFSDPTGDVRKRISQKLKGRKGRPHTAETRLKMGLWQIGRVIPEHQREAVRQSNKRRVDSPETRWKKGSSVRGKVRPLSLETRARIGDANRNPSPETRTKMSQSAQKRKASVETRAKISAALMGRPCSDETRAKIRAARLLTLESTGDL